MATTAVVTGINRAAMSKQLGLILGLAASVAVGVFVFNWSQVPNYQVLYTNLSGQDASAVADALGKAQIQFRVDQGTGAVLVPGSQVYDARMKLAAMGLPGSNSHGFEMLNKEQGFGTSEFIEKARYQRALEEELSRSIGHLTGVRSARVHLGIPKRTAFIRNGRKPTASVVLDLYSGRRLEPGQVQSIVHIVSASVPSLSPADVSVVDQRGTLLNGKGDDIMATTSRQFEYTQRFEQVFTKRIVAILMPFVGPDGIHAQVTASLDFSQVEQTRESFNPDMPALRSEQIMEENSSATAAGGVPGALSNQPPGIAQAPEATAAAADQSGPDSGSRRLNKRSTRNYELDRTISHMRSPTASVRRLSVAVVVDDHKTADKKGKITRTPLTEEELAKMTALVKQAVGFDAQRGDLVEVVNVSFSEPLPEEALPEQAIWEQAWVWDVGKQVLGGLFVIYLLFGVVRPTLRKAMQAEAPASLEVAALPPGEQAAGIEGEFQGQGQPQAALAGAGGAAGGGADPAMQLAAPGNMEQQVESVRGLVQQDPKLVAQVVKTWVGDDV